MKVDIILITPQELARILSIYYNTYIGFCKINEDIKESLLRKYGKDIVIAENLYDGYLFLKFESGTHTSTLREFTLKYGIDSLTIFSKGRIHTQITGGEVRKWNF